MALADYYARSAVAVSQALAGFDEQRIRAALEDVRVGVAIGGDAVQSPEGRALTDLLLRLLARFYPTLVVRSDVGSEDATERAISLARSINPKIDFADYPTVEVGIGTALPSPGPWPRIFVGSKNWNAHVGIMHPYDIGNSDNPLGAGVAACLGAANLFRRIFQGQNSSLDSDSIFSALEGEARESADIPMNDALGEVVLVGAGAIGNAAGWALSRVSMDGVVHVVDHELTDLGNLQRYILTERDDEGAVKVEVLARHFQGKVRAMPHFSKFEDFVSGNGYAWPSMILALDSARDRRAAQASLPKWIANAWTQPGDLGVSVHDFLDGACVACLYLAAHALENEDAIIAASLGISDRLMQIRTLLHNGQGAPRDLLEAIARSRAIPIERLLPYEGIPVRNLYTEGFCGGAVMPLGSEGTPRQDVHVPLAHQSALAGILLAGAAVRKALSHTAPATQVTRINLTQPLGSHLTQPAKKDERGICICQDNDYRRIFEQKYAQLRPSQAELVAEQDK